MIASTYGEVHGISCSRNHYGIDHPIIHFKRNLNQAIIGWLSSESVVDLRLDIYNEITAKFVKENALGWYMYKILSKCNQLCTVKKQIAFQLALLGFMSYVLQISGETPRKNIFTKNTGKVSYVIVGRCVVYKWFCKEGLLSCFI